MVVNFHAQLGLCDIPTHIFFFFAWTDLFLHPVLQYFQDVLQTRDNFRHWLSYFILHMSEFYCFYDPQASQRDAREGE